MNLDKTLPEPMATVSEAVDPVFPAPGAEPVASTDAVLAVSDLRVTFRHGGRVVHAVNGLSYELRPGRMLAIIGESGSGKSVSSRALMGLLPPSASVSGSARLGGTELIGLGERAMRRLRGTEIAMVFQDPARSLNPTMKIGAQIAEAILTHRGAGRDGGSGGSGSSGGSGRGRAAKRAAHERAIELLRLVRLPAPERRFHQYPHQLSGGMRQRVMIAIALAGDPRVLVADEATTALDVTTQAQIMELLVDLQERLGMAVLMISHDLGLAASYAQEVLVMYAGQAVEHAPTAELFANVRMPYTRALLGAIPQLSTPSHSELPVIGGHPPNLSALPQGCPFRPRCPSATEQCAEAPALELHGNDHWWACWHPAEPSGATVETKGERA